MRHPHPIRRSRILPLLTLLLLAVYGGWQALPENGAAGTPARPATDARQDSPSTFGPALSGRMIEVRGTVVRRLSDDHDGSRHQRFLIEAADGTSILVAHNIDLAPRIPDLRPGSTIRLFGEYEWNGKGGVLHWTHHAPRGDHADGWIEYRGERYQ